jgi:hypothetical protein
MKLATSNTLAETVFRAASGARIAPIRRLLADGISGMHWSTVKCPKL